MGVVEEGLVVVAFSLVAPVIFLSIFIDSHFISISIYCRCDHKFAIHLTIPGEAMPVAYYPHYGAKLLWSKGIDHQSPDHRSSCFFL